MVTAQPTEHELAERADRMRENPTPSELIALMRIREKYEYEHQFVFGFYILDFVIPSKLLIVEIDGGVHNLNKEYDAKRDTFCEKRGMAVLRVPNGKAQNVISLIEQYPDVENYQVAWRRVMRFTDQRKEKRRHQNNLSAEEKAEALVKRRENRKPRGPRKIKEGVSIEEHNAKILAKIERLKLQLR